MKTIPITNLRSLLAALLLLGAGFNQAVAEIPDAATDPRIDPQIRAFLAELDKNASPFWTLPGPQVRATLTGLQDKSPVDMSGVTITEKTVSLDDRKVKLYIIKPDGAKGDLPVIYFIHGGVWIAGDFDNHKRLVRDLVVGTGAASVFIEYTPIPVAVFPTQMEECYSGLKWVADHGSEAGLDGSRIAVAGNSVGGDMSAALTLMARDRKGPRISYQVLFVPATDASVDTKSYSDFGTGRFLTRDFMEFGWNIYAPDEKTRNNPYASPLRATLDQLKDLPPALVITAENDPLRDEGEAYAARLKEAGVSVAAVRYNGTIHDFVALNALRHVPSTVAALKQAEDGLREHLKP